MTADHAKPKKSSKRNNKLSLKEKIHNESPMNEFMVDEIVLCTIPGYAPWPARIKEIINQTIFVEFFGTGQMYVKTSISVYVPNSHCVYIYFRNPVRSGAISRFDVTKSIILLERKGYKKAIRELEIILNIPPTVSLFQ